MSLLGEGDTPLVESVQAEDVYYKNEGMNPSGSFKDRGSARIVEEAVESGKEPLHMVSSGNAALSLALYAGVHGIRCVCHLPDTTSEEKKSLLSALGAEIVTYPATYEEIYHLVEEKDLDGVNVTPGVSDTALDSYRDIASEILASGVEPEHVVIPCGNGTGLAGLWEGFKREGLEPGMVGVQVEGAAPLKKALDKGLDHAVVEEPANSEAEGIVASESFHSGPALKAVKESSGDIETVTDGQIQEGLQKLLVEGIICEPTSAVVKPVADGLEGTTVAIITGSGLKHVQNLERLVEQGK